MMYKIGTEGTQIVNCECSPEWHRNTGKKGVEEGWTRDERERPEERREERGERDREGGNLNLNINNPEGTPPSKKV